MAFCKSCNNEIPDGTKFCKFCGAPVAPATPVAPTYTEPTTPVAPTYTAPVTPVANNTYSYNQVSSNMAGSYVNNTVAAGPEVNNGKCTTMYVLIMIMSLLGMGMWFTPLVTGGGEGINIISYFKNFIVDIIDDMDYVMRNSHGVYAAVFLFALFVVIIVIKSLVDFIISITSLSSKRYNENYIRKTLKSTAGLYGFAWFLFSIAISARSLLNNGVALIVPTAFICVMIFVYAMLNLKGKDSLNVVSAMISSILALVVIYISTLSLGKISNGAGFTLGGFIANGLQGTRPTVLLVSLFIVLMYVFNAALLGTGITALDNGHKISTTMTVTGVFNVLLGTACTILVSINTEFRELKPAFPLFVYIGYGVFEFVYGLVVANVGNKQVTPPPTNNTGMYY